MGYPGFGNTADWQALKQGGEAKLAERSSGSSESVNFSIFMPGVVRLEDSPTMGRIKRSLGHPFRALAGGEQMS